MANNVKELMDTDWRVQASATLVADTNAAPGLLLVDISGLQGWIAASKLAITKVFWSINGTGTLFPSTSFVGMRRRNVMRLTCF